jgi:putative ABC transport system ATP-binding protein
VTTEQLAAIGEPVIDGPKIGQPADGQPAVGQPAVDEPVIDEPVIWARDLVKVYGMAEAEVVALDHVSFRVDRGEFVAIQGASGSGKSTLMSILGCLDVADSGSYRLNGAEVGELSQGQLAHLRRREIGFVFQAFNLIGRMDALANVELPMVYAGVERHERRARALAALELVGLLDRCRHKPAQLSGGQAQRVAVARALVNTPAMILADEPTGNLDSRSASEVLAALEAVNAQGRTVVLITHDSQVAGRAQRILTMRDGKLDAASAEVVR